MNNEGESSIRTVDDMEYLIDKIDVERDHFSEAESLGEEDFEAADLTTANPAQNQQEQQNSYQYLANFMSLNSQPGSDHFSWTSERFIPYTLSFEERPMEFNPSLKTQGKKELDYFLYFMDTEIVQKMVDGINHFYHETISKTEKPTHSRLNRWQNITKPEMYIFLAVCMLMTRNKHASVEEHWSTNDLLHSPIFSSLMSRNRFTTILSMLRTPVSTSNSKLNRIEILINHARDKYKNVVMSPSKTLCVEEGIVPFRGIFTSESNEGTKRMRYGIKLCVLRDLKTNLIIDFVVHCGANKIYDPDNLGVAGTIVRTLMYDFFMTNRHLYVNEWYSSPKLFKFLYENKIYACGKVLKAKFGMPRLNEVLKNCEASYRFSRPLTVIKWRYGKEMYLLSTIHGDQMTQTTKKDKLTDTCIAKPVAFKDYTKNMNKRSADIKDLMLSSLQGLCGGLLWYKKLFFHIVDMHVLNAYNSYKLVENKPKVTFAQFQLNLTRQLIETYNGENSIRKPVRGKRSSNPLRILPSAASEHMPTKAEKYQRCKQCAKQKKRKDTRYLCVICKVYLCASPCFQLYHK